MATLDESLLNPVQISFKLSNKTSEFFELISTGVMTKFICEKKENENWILDNKSYLAEEKQLTLKILSTASSLADSQLQ